MRGTTVAFLTLIGAGIFGVVNAVQMPLGKMRELGPGSFPLCLAGLLVIIGILGILTSKEEKRVPIDWRKIWSEFRIPLRIVLLTSGAIYFWESIGFLVTCILYLFFLFYWTSDHKLRASILMGFGGGIFTWFFFAKLLGVAVPTGILGF
jgi:hypothetical protein